MLFIPVELAASAKSGINEERAHAMLREGFAAHEQFSLMDEKDAESLERDLHPFAETTNIFESDALIGEAAASFHQRVLDELMVDHLAARLAEIDAVAR